MFLSSHRHFPGQCSRSTSWLIESPALVAKSNAAALADSRTANDTGSIHVGHTSNTSFSR